jgi:hypothetical protein
MSFFRSVSREMPSQLMALRKSRTNHFIISSSVGSIASAQIW